MATEVISSNLVRLAGSGIKDFTDFLVCERTFSGQNGHDTLKPVKVVIFNEFSNFFIEGRALNNSKMCLLVGSGLKCQEKFLNHLFP